MKTLYNKAEDNFQNAYEATDEWFIEEVGGRYYLMAREAGTDEWIAIKTARTLDRAEKAKGEQIEFIEWTLAHPHIQDRFEIVETGQTGHRFDIPNQFRDPQVIRVRIAPGKFEKRVLS